MRVHKHLTCFSKSAGEGREWCQRAGEIEDSLLPASGSVQPPYERPDRIPPRLLLMGHTPWQGHLVEAANAVSEKWSQIASPQLLRDEQASPRVRKNGHSSVPEEPGKVPSFCAPTSCRLLIHSLRGWHLALTWSCCCNIIQPATWLASVKVIFLCLYWVFCLITLNLRHRKGKR